MTRTTDNAAMSKLGFGCARIGSFNNAMSDRESERLLQRAFDLGITLFDTANIYGQGDSERIVGRVIRKRREAGFIVTKVGQTFSPTMRILRPFKAVLKPLIRRSAAARGGLTARRNAGMAVDFTPRSITKSIDGSLWRLGVDSIDALLLHSPAADDLLIPALDFVLTEARRAGKISHYGVACDDGACVEAALRFPNLAFLEVSPPVLADASAAIRNAVDNRGLKVIVREVIRFRGSQSPREAVAAMMSHHDVATVLIGTTSYAHLEDLARIRPHRETQEPVSSRSRATALHS